MKKTLYIVRGAPASGKTTLTPEFAKLLPQPTALLEQDNWRWGIHLVGRKIDEIEQHEHSFADKIFLKTLKEYLKTNRYNIVVEGIFNWNKSDITNITVQDFVNLADKYGYELKSVVLKAQKKHLLERNAKRQYTVPSVEFEKLHNAIYSTIHSSEHVIDSTKLNEEQALKKLIEITKF